MFLTSLIVLGTIFLNIVSLYGARELIRSLNPEKKNTVLVLDLVNKIGGSYTGLVLTVFPNFLLAVLLTITQPHIYVNLITLGIYGFGIAWVIWRTIKNK